MYDNGMISQGFKEIFIFNVEKTEVNQVKIEYVELKYI